MVHLPSFGFPGARKFADLVDDNRKLYRIHSDQSTSPLTEHGFVAGRYKDNIQSLPNDLSEIPDSYSDAAKRIGDWQERASPYISTTFSFSYAVWEAGRRERRTTRGPEPGIHISIIDARSVASHALTGLEALECPGRDNLKLMHDPSMVENFTNAESEVFVKGQIPSNAIDATIPWPQLRRSLPSFYNIFDYPAQPSKIRSADEALQAAFAKSYTAPKDQLQERKEKNIDLAIKILEYQDKHSSLDTDGAYEDFVASASSLAFDLAHFPCDRDEAQALKSTLKLRMSL